MDTNDPVTALAKALNAYVVSQDHIAESAAKLAAETAPTDTSSKPAKAQGATGGIPT